MRFLALDWANLFMDDNPLTIYLLQSLCGWKEIIIKKAKMQF